MAQDPADRAAHLSVAMPSIEGLARTVAISKGAGLQPDGAAAWLGFGADYRARFTAAGCRFEPALGNTVEAPHRLVLQPWWLGRTGHAAMPLPSAVAPVAHGMAVHYEHGPGVVERFDVTPSHVALSWTFAVRPPGHGDLVVRYRVDTSLPSPLAGGDGLVFELPGIGGVTIGGVTGIDAEGRSRRGTIGWDRGMLELRLPGAFVDAARYPLVLDPLVGPTIQVGGGQGSALDDEPDVAFDPGSDTWLVVWQRRFAQQAADLRAQRVSWTGLLIGPQLSLTSVQNIGRPRVAALASRQRFGIVWRDASGSYSIRFLAVDATTGQISHAFTVASAGAGGNLLDPDIGADPNAPIGSDRGFVVVYEDDFVDAIRMRRISFDATDALLSPPPSSVFTDTGGLGATAYTGPQISRAGSQAGDLLVAARRQTSLGPTFGVSIALVASNTSTVGATATLTSSSLNDVSRIDVDGYAGRYVVAWQQAPVGGGFASLVVRPVALDAGGLLMPGVARTAVTSTAALAYRYPTLGYTPGRTWLCYQTYTNSVAGVRVSAIDSRSCTNCSEAHYFSSGQGLDTKRVVVATGTSGGMTNYPLAFAVWATPAATIQGQVLRNHGSGGGHVDLGGACGAGGTQTFSHAPGIGSSGLVCRVIGLSTTALVTIFNFGPVEPPLQCGPCAWNPFVVTLTPPIASGQANVQFPIPCLPSLVGSQFETQWTTIDPTQVACSLLPGAVVSNRSRMTIGN